MFMFHNNSQGLINLDKFIGARYTSDACKRHPKFGPMIMSYCIWCNGQQCAPRGRAIWAMCTIMCQLDRARYRSTLTVHHLFEIKLAGWSIQQMSAFIESIRRIMMALDRDDVMDRRILYQWFLEQVRGWNRIEKQIEKLRDSKENSKRRTFEYLWWAINKVLNFAHEEANWIDFKHCLLYTSPSPRDSR